MALAKWSTKTGEFELVVMHNEEFHPLVGWVPCIALSIHGPGNHGMAFTFDRQAFEQFADAVAAFAAEGPQGVPDQAFKPDWEAFAKDRGRDYKAKHLAAGNLEAGK